MSEQKEYRCTRNKPYSAPGCLGHGSVKIRQGYYVRATSALDAAMKMYIDYPEEAFSGFTIQTMGNAPWVNERELFTWTIADGLKAEGDDIVGGEAERLCLLCLYMRMKPYIGQRDPMGVVAGLRESLTQENEERITIAAHRHRHGTSLIAYRSKRDLLEEDIIELLGEDFESGRDDEYIEEIASSSIKGIEYIEV